MVDHLRAISASEASRGHFWFTPSKSHRRKPNSGVYHKTENVPRSQIRGYGWGQIRPPRSFEAALRPDLKTGKNCQKLLWNQQRKAKMTWVAKEDHLTAISASEVSRGHFWFTPSKSHRRKPTFGVYHKKQIMFLDHKLGGTGEVKPFWC